MKTAIIYGTGFTGHTRKIAEYVAKKIEADVYNAKENIDINFADYGRIIIGTNVHFGKPNAKVLDFCAQHSDCIAGKKPRLFIVCSKNGVKGEEQAKRIAAEFCIDKYYVFSGEKDANGMPVKLTDFIQDL